MRISSHVYVWTCTHVDMNTYSHEYIYMCGRENIALAESAGSGKSIFEYDPNSNGAKDYLALTEEIISRNQ